MCEVLGEGLPPQHVLSKCLPARVDKVLLVVLNELMSLQLNSKKKRIKTIFAHSLSTAVIHGDIR